MEIAGIRIISTVGLGLSAVPLYLPYQPKDLLPAGIWFPKERQQKAATTTWFLLRYSTLRRLISLPTSGGEQMGWWTQEYSTVVMKEDTITPIVMFSQDHLENTVHLCTSNKTAFHPGRRMAERPFPPANAAPTPGHTAWQAAAGLDSSPHLPTRLGA